MDKYIMQKSNTRPNGWVITDTVHGSTTLTSCFNTHYFIKRLPIGSLFYALNRHAHTLLAVFCYTPCLECSDIQCINC